MSLFLFLGSGLLPIDSLSLVSLSWGTVLVVFAIPYLNANLFRTDQPLPGDVKADRRHPPPVHLFEVA